MNFNTLQEINQASRDKRDFALITNLQNGVQSFFFPDDEQDKEWPSEQASLSLQQDKCRLIENETQELFIQPFSRPLRMIVIGAVHIAQSLVRLASQCAYEVVLVDPRQAFCNQERFPDTQISNDWPDVALQKLDPDQRTAIVTLSHDPKIDDPALEIALASKAFYIGALGSRRTHASRLERLTEKGFPAEEQERIHAPVGMDIGAQSPAEIAIAIMAEITATIRN